MEKRTNTRILFNVTALVKYKEKEIKCSVENLSLNGILVKTDENIPVGEEVNINILMEGSTSHLTINLEGIVKRSDDSEMAAAFKSMDLDSFIHLKNIIVYNEGDEEKIMKEFFDTVKTST
ncbi:MAG: PilZ domain-containing protein [Spirochaetes bacterium]|nr:PilZ domain-containing protein [Spirochaetota bacterium]